MKVVYTVILLFFLTNSFGTIRIVKHNGTGQFSSIQSAITASANGDTILVYPGTYFENIDYSGKNITIASLELTTGNAIYRDSTIIDGNNNGSCVRVMLNETSAEIFGFTLQHGSGTPYLSYGATVTTGGGIRILNGALFKVSHCLIKDNKATEGGGIAVLRSSVTLKGTTITSNYVSKGGGGVLVEAASSRIYFDDVDRCSIYENYAGFVNDVLCIDTGIIVDVFINIATINPPTDYYIKFIKSLPTWPGNFGTVSILQGCRTEINHDLYISPEGDDSNDGFSPLTPKKTIAKALHTIASDSLSQKTIYLTPGTYSSIAGQLFPLNQKAYVNLIGDANSPAILVNRSYESTIYAGYAPNISVSNLVLEHGDYRPINIFTLLHSDNSVISNLTINPVNALSSSGLDVIESKCDLENVKLTGLLSYCNSGIVYSSSYGSIRNCSIDECHNFGTDDNPEFSIFDIGFDSLLTIENLSITNCSVNTVDASIVSISCFYSENPILRMSDVLVANNISVGQSPILFDVPADIPALISNCTFANNTGTSVAVKIMGDAQVSNCIFDNYNENEISIKNTVPYGFISTVDFNNNLIRDYPGSVYVHSSNQVTFNEFNFSADPSLIGNDFTNPLSYRLNSSSPCIDAGTPDTTGLYLPLTDLYGNRRIYNGIIDIGCYEWNGVPNQDDNMPVPDTNTLSIYPNPFINSTSLCYNLDKASNVILEVYNTKGQRVKRLVNSKQTKGKQIINWDGKDENGIPCTTGIYLIKLSRDNTKSQTKKITHIQ